MRVENELQIGASSQSKGRVSSRVILTFTRVRAGCRGGLVECQTPAPTVFLKSTDLSSARELEKCIHNWFKKPSRIYFLSVCKWRCRRVTEIKRYIQPFKFNPGIPPSGVFLWASYSYRLSSNKTKIKTLELPEPGNSWLLSSVSLNSSV